MAIFLSKKDKKTKQEENKSDLVPPSPPQKGTTGIDRITLIRPHFSEKAVNARDSFNKYVFWVRTDANKSVIRREIEKRYGVKVIGVNMLNRRGKVKYFRNKAGRRRLSKKAIVTLRSGDKIEIT